MYTHHAPWSTPAVTDTRAIPLDQLAARATALAGDLARILPEPANAAAEAYTVAAFASSI